MPTQGDLVLTALLYAYLLGTLFCTLLQVLWERVERKKWIYIHLWTISNYGPQLAPNKKRGTGKQTDQWGRQGRKEGTLCVLDSGLVQMPLSWSNDRTGVSAYGCSVVSVMSLWDPVDCSPPGSSVHGFLQARILEWLAVPSSRGSSWPRDRTLVSCISCIVGGFFTAEPPGKPLIELVSPVYLLMK